MSQTGGGCRASTLLGFIRPCLRARRYATIPVYLVKNAQRMETNPGFKITLPLLWAMQAVVYGDLFMPGSLCDPPI